MELKSIVPWGRSLSEYQRMFSLSQSDLQKKILGCGDGPASFNMELNSMGGNVISIDPVYKFSSTEIKSRIKQVTPEIIEQMKLNYDRYLWNDILNLDELLRLRMDTMNKFIQDFETGKRQKKYINSSLPDLPFENMEFELSLCSHYLFLYSEQLSLKQHILAMEELCRVSKEVRVYPLVTLKGVASQYVLPVVKTLGQKGFQVSMNQVDYQFQKGATKMLVVKCA